MALKTDSPKRKRACVENRKRWLDLHPEKRREYTLRYYRKNRHKILERNKSRPTASGKPDKIDCVKCGIRKPYTAEFFQPRNQYKFKLDYTCRACANSYSLANFTRLKYGLTIAEAKKLRASPCMICGKSIKRMHIDHSHATGKVRGVLCQNCNHGLGNFFDRRDLLCKAMSYLEAAGE